MIVYWAFSFNGFKSQLLSALEESFIVLTVLNRTQHAVWNAERRMTDSRRRQLEFNDINIHLYLTLNYGTASEHLDFDIMVLYNALVLLRGLTITQNSICTISDLDRSRLSDTRSAENDRIWADTNPEYRIDASLVLNCRCLHCLALNCQTPLKMLATDAKKCRKSNLNRFFYDRRKFRRQCVNVIDTAWGRVYFLMCENFGLGVQWP